MYRGYNTFPCSIQLCKKLILLINVKMPTIVGILMRMSKINTAYECLKQDKAFFSILLSLSN